MNLRENIEIIINHFLERTWERKGSFFLVFFFSTLITYTGLVLIDFVPEPISEIVEENNKEVISEIVVNDIEEVVDVYIDPLPIKLIFDQLDKEVTVLNPLSGSIADLDAALLNGVVRHPGSADFSEPGNIFILGHSSYLPNVFNKNFQAFNGIQKLEWGDTIRLQSADIEYVYSVEEVFKAKASDVIVPVTPGKANLTLATCNSFASKDDRFIVEAKLIDSYPL